MGAALDVFDVVLMEELLEDACKFIPTICSDLKWPSIRAKYVLQYPCLQITGLSSWQNIQNDKFAEIIHTDNNVASLTIRHLQPRGKVNTPRLPRAAGSKVAGDHMLSSEDSIGQLAAQAGLAEQLHLLSHSRPGVGELQGLVSSLPSHVYQVFMCFVNYVSP